MSDIGKTIAGRFSNIAPIGSLLKGQPAPRRKSFGLERLRRVEEPSHLVLVRACPCLACGLDGFSEAAHVRLNCAALGKRTGIGEKPSDRWTVPLCASCHRLDTNSQHKAGEIPFWNRIGINPLRAAQALHRASPDLVAMRAVAIMFIASRGR